MTSDISSFISNFQGGARPNRFEVIISGTPTGLNVPSTIKFMCHAASIPEVAIGRVDIPYMGRIVKISGDRDFADWTISVYNDLNWNLRNFFESWVNNMLEHVSNTTRFPNFQNYIATAEVSQLNRSGSKIITYTLDNVFPINVSPIVLDYSSNNTIETFDVTLVNTGHTEKSYH